MKEPHIVLPAPVKYCCVPFLPGRQYTSEVITVTIKKMEKFGTFSSLTHANEQEKAKTSKLYDILIRSVLCSVLPCLNAESQTHSHSVHSEMEIKPNKTKIQKGFQFFNLNYSLCFANCNFLIWKETVDGSDTDLS